MTQPNSANPSSAQQWAGDRVERWLRMVDALERQLQPVLRPLFDAAAIAPGESVLDVGCGAGPATREAAARTGASGRVTGLDVSAQMLSAAAERADEAAIESVGADAVIDWVEADTVTWNPASPANPVAPLLASYDVVISRFGVMFFSDPAAAVANLAAATRVGGRFAAAAWGRREESPMFDLSYRVATDTLVARAVEVSPASPVAGPFSWHDPLAVVDLLTTAGWHDVAVTSHTMRLKIAGGVSPDTAAQAALEFGPTQGLVSDADPDALAAVRTALVAAFSDHLDDNGHVVLDAAVRIVTAQR